MKKTKEAEQKQQAKKDKNREKAKENAHINDIRRLALSNSCLNAFQDVLSDPPSSNNDSTSNPPAKTSATVPTTGVIPSNQTPARGQAIDKMQAALINKQSRMQQIASVSRKAQSLSPPSTQIEYI